MTEMKTIPHITPEELHDFWPNGFDAGEVAGVCERAAAEIERLSRERDTGVPEGWTRDEVVEIAIHLEERGDMHRPTVQGGGLGLYGASDGQLDVDAARLIRAMLSAAPQPPTVSTQGWQDIRTAPEQRSETMLVDQKCHDLACYFMDGLNWRPEDKQELAEAIQTLCEDMTRIVEEDPDAPFNNADTPFAENH